jgi:hypothetical protein
MSNKKVRFVTTLTRDYVPGTYTLINSIKINGCLDDFDLTVVEYEKLEEEDRIILESLGISILFVDLDCLWPEDLNIPEVSHERLQINTNKPLIWRLPYDENMIYLDSDMICMSDIRGIENWKELTVAQKHSDNFNSGLMCFRPSEETFQIINEQAGKYTSPIQLGDQRTLMDVFTPSNNGVLSDRIKFVGCSWNVQGNMISKYKGKKVKIKFLHLHFDEKPWNDEPVSSGMKQCWEEWSKYSFVTASIG